MAIQFDCPACGKKTQAPDDMAGKAARCPLCQAVIEVPLPGFGTTAPPPPTPRGPKIDEDEGRKPCPMCGEPILLDAAKCRFCGEILDEELRKVSKKSASAADSAMNPGDYVVAILCSGIGCIMGVVWMIQGKPKGLKMFLISLVVWLLLVMLQLAAGQ